MPPAYSKRCSRCKRYRALPGFFCNRARPDGRQGECKTCQHGRTRVDARRYLGRKYSDMRRQVEGRTARQHYDRRYYKGLPIMPKDEFIEWALADPAFNQLWDRWQALGRPMREAPSIDRIDTLRGYVPGNVQFITHSQNSIKACLWLHWAVNPVKQLPAITGRRS